MPLTVAVMLTAPILLLTLVVGLVVIVALCRAETKDVPTVWRDSITVLGRLADRVSTAPRHQQPRGLSTAPQL